MSLQDIRSVDEIIILALLKYNKKTIRELNSEIPGDIIFEAFNFYPETYADCIKRLVAAKLLEVSGQDLVITDLAEQRLRSLLKLSTKGLLAASTKAFQDHLYKIAGGAGSTLSKPLALAEAQACKVSNLDLVTMLRNLWLEDYLNPKVGGFTFLREP